MAKTRQTTIARAALSPGTIPVQGAAVIAPEHRPEVTVAKTAPTTGNRGPNCRGQEHTQSPSKGRGAHSVPSSPRASTSSLASAPLRNRDLGPWGYCRRLQIRGRFRGAD